MNNNTYKINLYKHNADSFDRVNQAFSSGETFVGILQATGTGKTFQALELILEHPEKKALYICPNNSIIEHVKNTINELGLSLEKDFPNLTFMTYQGLSNMEDEDIEKIDTDLIVLDEFHHIGAPVWGAKVNTLVNSHPDAWKFAMSAYSVRRRGTEYERDMARPGGNELFSDKIVTRYDMADAMVDGVLPIPTFISAKLDIEKEIEKLESTLSSYKDEKLRSELESDLIKIKRLLPKSNSVQELLMDVLSLHGKYIYFCPPGKTISINNSEIEPDESNTEVPTVRLIDAHITIIQNILSSLGLIEGIDYTIYKTLSDMQDSGQEERKNFYNDKTNNMRIMFNINQYGEGVHAPEVTGIIMSRSTESDIVAFEQIGRTLSVDDTTNNYASFDLDMLIEIATERHINITDIIKTNLSEEEKRKVLIDRLSSPYVIDLAGNIKFIKELEDRIKDKVEGRIQRGGYVSPSALSLYNGDYTILDVNNGKLNEELETLKTRMTVDKVAEFIEELNKGNKDILSCPCTGCFFSNGDNYNWYYDDQKKKIRERLLTDSKYDTGYETAKKLLYYRENYHLPEKIIDFIELLNHGNERITVLKNEYQFPNGDSMGTFWVYHKNEIIDELRTNPRYQVGYDTAKRIVEKRLYEATSVVVQNKIKEFLDILVTGDTSVLIFDNTHKFKNGSPMAQFLTMYKDRIYKYIEEHEEYARCSDFIEEYYYNRNKENRIKEFIEYLEAGHPEILLSKNDAFFKNGQSMSRYFSDRLTKIWIKRELYENPEYASYEKARKYIEEYEFKLDPTNKIREFIELVNNGQDEILQVLNNKTFADGMTINHYFSKNKERIIELLDTDEYSEGYDYAKEKIKEYRYNNELGGRIHDFIEMANQGREDIFVQGQDTEFKNGDLTSKFWTRHRYKIIAILESSPIYAVGYDKAKEIINNFEQKHGDTSKKKLANTYKMPYDEVKDIPMSELLAKCEYLKSNKMSTTIGSGIHEIFNMSSKRLEQKYGITLEEMINEYCLSWSR